MNQLKIFNVFSKFGYMFVNDVLVDWLTAFSLNFLLIAFAQRYPLLTRIGWVHAGILGTILWGCLGWTGWMTVVIYLVLGSLVTKIGYSYKKARGIAEGRDGRRGPENVWGSAATGAILALLFKLFSSFSQYQYIILIAFASSFSSKLADTFGSEIGKRWGRKTFLITSLKPVKAGTDGAISFEGTVASLVGSFVMTLVMYVFSFVNSFSAFLIVLLSGFVATIAESLFGAIYQDKFKWLTNEVVNFLQTSFASILSIWLALIFLTTS
ncbi:MULTISPECIES: TIGR00297 family protein [Prochlorococcus]|uniref:Uncharacterized conserved membrane protein n=2 Tax=Prochlorococcaceae TaxID=2881426 RepID=Q7VBR9_PROMA|nr:Uncharacterized conserved membrane protein [Prochlorococcus marinus subsp. marinus str. CCMP1375]